MEPELKLQTKEIPAKGKGYFTIEKCWPDQLDEAVRRIWVDSRSTYGYLRVCAQLRREGVVVDRKTVAASMRRQGLAGRGLRLCQQG